MQLATPSLEIDRIEPSRRQQLALVALCLAQFAIVLAFQGTAIVLPEVERSWGLSAASSQWLVSANAVAFGGLLLPAGRLADLYGHRRLFILGIMLFGGSSVLAGLAPTYEWLIVGRILQGVSAALFAPATFALIADMFPEGPQRRRALAAWGTAGPLGGVIAILAGGALAGAMGWRAMFLLGVPLTIPVVILARTAFPDLHHVSKGRGIDAVTTVTGVLGIGAVVYGLSTMANAKSFTAGSMGWLALGIALMGLWFVRERQATYPLIAGALRRQWAMWQPIAVSFFHGAAINTPIVFYGVFMQRYRDASPWEIGLGFLPCNVAIIAASVSSSRLARRIGFRLVMVTGMVLVAAGLLVLTTISPERSYMTTILPGWIVVGLGVGASQVGIVGTATERAPEEERGVVGGLVGTMAQIGTAVGLALLVIVGEQFAADLDGLRAAFAAGSVLALAGLMLALPSPRRRQRTRLESARDQDGGVTA